MASPFTKGDKKIKNIFIVSIVLMQTNFRKQKSILGIDRGTKYIGLAYALPGSDVIFPIGYILNDRMMYFNVAGIIEKHNVGKIMLGRPAKQKDIQEKIQGFMKSL